MNPEDAARHAFSYLPPRSRVARPLRDLRERIARSEDVARLVAPSAGSRLEVVSDLKPEPRERGGFKLRRWYWSLQRREADGRFDALTLEHYAKRPEPAWHRFPRDPMLATDALPADATVLRYVPLRRLTFSSRERDGRPLIGKLKRGARFGEACERLATVAAAVQRADPGFDVAALHRVDERRGLYFQDLLPGRDLAGLLGPDNAVELLARLGALLAALHELPTTCAGPAKATTAGALETAARDAAWVAHAWPAMAEPVAGCLQVLRAHTPAETVPVFCHGDFACSQVLVDQRWSVVDFDRCVAADRHAELGRLLASLHYDPPALADDAGAPEPLQPAAVDALLDAYSERAGLRPDPARLAWHRAAAELGHLALRLCKDRAAETAMHAGLRRLQAACAVLDEQAVAGLAE